MYDGKWGRLMKLKYYEGKALDALKSDIKSNISNYCEKNKWADDYLCNKNIEKNFNISRVKINEIKLKETDNPDDDKENAKILYSSLRQLKPVQATDERIWAYLTHEICWSYMEKRWSVKNKLEKKGEDKNPNNLERFIKKRYFLNGGRDRALIKNGIARLWWCGYTAYDEKRENPFELLDVLFETQDVMESIMGRSFSRNREITHKILEILHDIKITKGRLPKRETVREIMKQINGVGGATLLDMVDPEMFRRIVEDFTNKEKSTNIT